MSDKQDKKDKKIVKHYTVQMMENIRGSCNKISDKHGPHIAASVLLSVAQNMTTTAEKLMTYLFEHEGMDPSTLEMHDLHDVK